MRGTCPVNYSSPLPLRISAEEDRRSKNSLKGPAEAPVLGAALLHLEGVQHLGGALKSDPPRPLPDGQSREEDRDETVLAPLQPVTRVFGDLENWPLRRSCSRQPDGGLFTGSPQSTNGRDENPRFCRASSRFKRPQAIVATLRMRRFEMRSSG
jgi:hypothetical protein